VLDARAVFGHFAAMTGVWRMIVLASLSALIGCAVGDGPPGSPYTATVHLNGQTVVGIGFRR
jgi:hypothetical protein